jgi:hypothetical protein
MNRVPRYCCPNLHRNSPMFHCWNQALGIVGFVGCSPNKNSSWCREQHEGRLIWLSRSRFQLSDVQVLWTWHRLRIWALLSVIRGLVLQPCRGCYLRSSLRTVFVETGTTQWLHIQFCWHLCWSSSAIFRKILFTVRRFISVSVDFRSLFLFADVVFPWFVYADITLESGALDTPNNAAVFITDTPAKRAPTICTLS